MNKETQESPSFVIDTRIHNGKKLEAIVALSRAVEALAHSLNAVHTKVRLENIKFENSSNFIGIEVKGTDLDDYNLSPDDKE